MSTCTAVDAHLRSTYDRALNLLAASTNALLDFGVIELMAAHATSAHRLQTSRAFAASLLLLLGPEQRWPRITCTAAAGSSDMLDIEGTRWQRRKQQSLSKAAAKSYTSHNISYAVLAVADTEHGQCTVTCDTNTKQR
jgi:hypothetical protein